MSLFYRALLSIIVLALGLGVILTVVIIPAVSNIKMLSFAIAQEHIRIEKTVSGALGLRKTASDVERIKTKLPQLLELFIKPGREIELFALLEEKSRESKLLDRLRLGETKAVQPTLLTLPLEVELRGELKNTLRFINTLETLPLLLSVEKLELRRSPTLDKEELISTLGITAYVHK